MFIGLESINPESLMGSRKKQNKIAEYRKMLLEWKRAGVTIFAGYIVGFPSDTPESVRRDIGIIQRELPIDLLEPHCLTPLPGSEDHLSCTTPESTWTPTSTNTIWNTSPRHTPP